MQRRKFITLFGGAAAAWPLAGRRGRRMLGPGLGFPDFQLRQRYDPTDKSWKQWVG
jgi:hypothetical protein